MHLYKMKMCMTYIFKWYIIIIETQYVVLSRILADFSIMVKLQNWGKFAQANLLYKSETNRMQL